MDSTPYADNGTISGTVTSTTDREGATNGAYSFSGGGSIGVTSESQLDPTNAITVSAWVNLANVTSSNADTGVVIKGSYIYGITRDQRSGDQLLIHTYINGGGNDLTTDVPNYNQWALVTYTYDDSLGSSQWKVYVNGSQMGSKTYSTPISNSGNIAIGANSSQYFNGSISDVRIYNRALSSSEVTALYKQYNPGVSTDAGENGLVGWWKMQGNAMDSTPYADNGTVTGATLTTGREGAANSAYSFPGTSGQTINLPGNGPYDSFGTHSFTIASWIQTTDTGGQRCIFSTAGSGQGFRFGFGAGLPYYLVGDGTHYQEGGIGSTTLNNGSWHDLVIVYTYTTNWMLTAYIDGTSVGSISLSSSIGSVNNTYANIGSMAGSGTAGVFAGNVEDVRAYDRALSASEITNLYKSYNAQVELGGSGTSGSVSLGKGLVGYWPLSGNANDSTPYADNGTVNGATLTTDRKGAANSAYSFNGSSNDITLPGTILDKPATFNSTGGANGAMTISYWLYPTRTSGVNYDGFLYHLGGADYCAIVSDASRIVRCMVRDVVNNVNYWPVTNSQIPANTWTNVVFELLGGVGYKFYINGSLDNSVSDTNLGFLDYGDNPILGISDGGNYFQGSMADLRIYNRALSSAEVQALYNEYE